MHETLVNGLDALTNLTTITITQVPFSDTADPAVGWGHSTHFDPLIDIFHAVLPETNAILPPRVYGLGAALSIFRDLDAQNNISLDLIVCTSQTGITLWRGIGILALFWVHMLVTLCRVKLD